MSEEDWKARALRAEGWVRSMDARNEPDGLPTCPRCQSHNGILGTSNAYFICYNCSKIVYWTPDGQHPAEHNMSWDDAIMLSPWSRKSDVERIARKRTLQEREELEKP